MSTLVDDTTDKATYALPCFAKMMEGVPPDSNWRQWVRIGRA